MRAAYESVRPGSVLDRVLEIHARLEAVRPSVAVMRAQHRAMDINQYLQEAQARALQQAETKREKILKYTAISIGKLAFTGLVMKAMVPNEFWRIYENERQVAAAKVSSAEQ